MDRAVALWLLSLAACALAFFAPFTILRLRRVELKPALTAVFAVVAALVVLYAVEKAADLDGDSLALLFALGFLPLGIAAGARGGWRFVAPAGGALGLVVLALMAWGPLHPIYRSSRIPLPPPITPLTWAMLLAGALLLLVPRRWASAPAAALLWLALVVAARRTDFHLQSELDRVYYMAGPAFVALAAWLSAMAPRRERESSPPHGTRSPP